MSWGYRETDALGGKDPYSASKGMVELAIRSYVGSLLNRSKNNIKLGIARAVTNRGRLGRRSHRS